MAFECDDHLVNCWRRDQEEALEVGFGRRLPVEQHVRVNEGQVLALLLGELGRQDARNDAEREQARVELLAYCKQATWWLVELARTLRNLAG